MNALFGLLAAPAAASVADVAGRTVKLAATPFELLLNAAVGGVDASAAESRPVDGADGAGDLQDHVARRLQELLESVGAGPGDELTIRVDNAGFRVDGSPDAARVEEALRNDAQLAEDLRRLAEINDLFDGSPFALDEDLRVEVGEPGSVVRLEWL
jgi:hypothetical protein